MSLNVLRGFTLWVNDTHNLYFEIDTLQLAQKEEKTETFQPGGGDLEMDISGLGVARLQCPFKVKSHSPDVIGLFGGPPGVRQTFTGKKLIIDEKDGAEHEHAIDMRGRLVKVGDDEMQAGRMPGYDNMIGSIDRYTEIFDDKVMHKFDFWAGGWITWNFQSFNDARRRVLLT